MRSMLSWSCFCLHKASGAEICRQTGLWEQVYYHACARVGDPNCAFYGRHSDYLDGATISPRHSKM